MTATEAQEWAEEHLTAEEYEAEFGAQEEATSDLTTRERVTLTLDIGIVARLRKHSADTGIPMARTVDNAIVALLDKEKYSLIKIMNEMHGMQK